MGLNANKANPNAGANRVAQPDMDAGVYPARVVQLIDMGIQPQRAHEGKDKPPCQEIMLTYELVDEFMVDEDGEILEDKPRWVSETLPFYGLFADRAKSTQRYYALDPKEDLEGDFAKTVGMACNVTIVINKKGDKVYTNVASIAAMRPKDADKLPALKNDPKVFDLEAPDMAVFNKLPKWIQDKLKGNLGFKGSPLEKALEGEPAAPKEEEKKATPAKKNRQPVVEEDDSDDNPY